MVEVSTAPVLVPNEKVEVENGDTPASPPPDNGRPRAKERAEAFVREQLANGPRHSELVKRDAAEYAKISERTLIAAADRLGVRSQRGRGGCRATRRPAARVPRRSEQIAFNQD
jgi:hypothetical protein